MDLIAWATWLAKASCPEDVYGDDPMTLEALGKAHRKIVVQIHPDRYSGTDFELACACFRQLEVIHTHAEHKIKKKTYGDRKPVDVPSSPVATKHTPQVIRTTTTKGEYLVADVIGHGDLATVYEATSSTFPDAKLALKLADHPGDNDLLEHEAKILALLYPKPTTTPPKGGLRFISPLLDTFSLRSGKSQRRVNVTGRAIEHVSLAEVLEAHPNGLDFRDVVWIFKRMLYALWFVHGKGVVHGSVIPPHVMVHPTGHGAKLIDWCYAVSDWESKKQHVRAISKPFEAYYPPEILAKKAPSPATDIYMAARCAIALLGGNVETAVMPKSVPVQIQAFLQSCLIPAQGRRPNDAGALHEEFDELLLRLVGKPTYRPLAMPGK